jgi:hypothetical protein
MRICPGKTVKVPVQMVETPAVAFHARSALRPRPAPTCKLAPLACRRLYAPSGDPAHEISSRSCPQGTCKQKHAAKPLCPHHHLAHKTWALVTEPRVNLPRIQVV